MHDLEPLLVASAAVLAAGAPVLVAVVNRRAMHRRIDHELGNGSSASVVGLLDRVFSRLGGIEERLRRLDETGGRAVTQLRAQQAENTRVLRRLEQCIDQQGGAE